jgi:hypothetical protein
VRRAPGDELEQARAERIDVGAPIGRRLGFGLLGSHVRGRSHHDAGTRESRIVGERHAEIDELGLRRIGVVDSKQKDVRRLDVAVNDACRVCRVEGERDLASHVERRLERERRPPLPGREVLALEPFHGDERHLLVRPAGDELHDVRVIEVPKDASFPLKSRLFGGVDARGGNELEGDRLAALTIDRAVDHTDAASADLALDLEPSTEGGQRTRARLHGPPYYWNSRRRGVSDWRAALGVRAAERRPARSRGNCGRAALRHDPWR